VGGGGGGGSFGKHRKASGEEEDEPNLAYLPHLSQRARMKYPRRKVCKGGGEKNEKQQTLKIIPGEHLENEK